MITRGDQTPPAFPLRETGAATFDAYAKRLLETRTYKEIAAAAGNSKASRAVGMANNRNPIPIIIPCHRVIGTNGSLTGYAGGLKVKEYLLKLERENCDEN